MAIETLLWLGETTLAVSALILLVLLIRKPFARFFGARAIYALWFAPALRLFLPEMAILEPAAATPIETIIWAAQGSSAPTNALTATPAFDLATLGATLALLIWLIVAFAIFNIKMATQSRFSRDMRATSHAAHTEINDIAQAIAKNLGHKGVLRIRICDTDYGPAVIGLFRPIIFLPADFETKYTAKEQHLALAHEIAHITRGDMIVTLGAIVFQAAQWPNPLVHFAYSRFRTDQEAACDAYVLARKGNNTAASDYASAIVKSANGTTNSPAYGLSLAHPVKERLMLLKNPKNGPLRKFAGVVAVLALTAAGLASTASYGYAAEEKRVVKKRVYEVEVEADSETKKERRVVIVDGDGDEDFNDVLVLGDNDFEFISEDGEHRVIKLIGPHGDKGGHRMMTECHAAEGEAEPVKLEWTDEEGDGDGKYVSKSVICLTGEEAKPENRAAALRKAIDKMEASAKEEEARRKKMIAGLRKQLREMEKNKK